MTDTPTPAASMPPPTDPAPPTPPPRRAHTIIGRLSQAVREQNWDRLVAEQQRAGLSPVDALPADALAARFRQDAALIAAAKTYWLFTNRHLALMGDLRREADALLARLDAAPTPLRYSNSGRRSTSSSTAAASPAVLPSWG